LPPRLCCLAIPLATGGSSCNPSTGSQPRARGIVPIQSTRPAGDASARRRRGVLRLLLLLMASAAIAAAAVLAVGPVRDYGSFRASLLAGSPGGAYHALASRLSERATRDGGRLEAVATAGSIENVDRLIADRVRCVEKFAFIQDGAPVPTGSGLELLGRLPERESLLLLGRRGHPASSLADLRGAAIGIGPEGSGTAYLMRQLFADPDLAQLNVRLSYHALEDQARLAAQGELDLAAYVMRDDAELLRTIIRKNDLDIADLEDMQGLISRYSWLSLGKVPAGRYDLVRETPSTDKIVPQVNTLIVASPCAKRADRIEFLTLLSAELAGFVRGNPPSATSSVTALPLSQEARQFFLTGEPEFADRYFPWLVNLMSPAYWVYLVMAVTALFNAMRGFSRFRLWRIDAAREKLESEVRKLAGDVVIHAATQEIGGRDALSDERARAEAQDILGRLTGLRARCQRHANSFATPMGDEMFYRYQQSMIDHTTVILRTLLKSPPRSE
jgi:TRAP-type uncharacterized transport system substrate-binding protein